MGWSVRKALDLTGVAAGIILSYSPAVVAGTIFAKCIHEYVLRKMWPSGKFVEEPNKLKRRLKGLGH